MQVQNLRLRVPALRIELRTFSLRSRRTTTVLNRPCVADQLAKFTSNEYVCVHVRSCAFKRYKHFSAFAIPASHVALAARLNERTIVCQSVPKAGPHLASTQGPAQPQHTSIGTIRCGLWSRTHGTHTCDSPFAYCPEPCVLPYLSPCTFRPARAFCCILLDQLDLSHKRDRTAEGGDDVCSGSSSCISKPACRTRSVNSMFPV